MTRQPRKPRTAASGVAGEGSARDRLLDACEAIMREEGYAAVTTRRLADAAGVTSPLIHYYFSSMEALFVSLYRERAEATLPALQAALQDADDVLRVLWEQSNNPIDAVLHMEFFALANHRKSVRDEMVKYGEQFRRIQRDALQHYLDTRGIVLSLDVETLIVLMASTGLLLTLERNCGMRFGHRQAQSYFEKLIAQYRVSTP